MIWIVLLVVLAVALLGVLALAPAELRKLGFGALVSLAILITGARSIKVVKAGEVAVVKTFGDITGQRGEGLAIIAPWQTVHTESIKVQSARFEDVSAFSEETQDVFATLEINYRVEDRAVQDLLRNVGTNWFEVLIDGRVQNFFKEETVKFKTDDVAPNRELIRRATQVQLQASLEQYSIEVTELLIVNVTFSPEYMSAIEQKQIAKQNALKSVEEVAITRAEADMERERARGVSDAAVIEAEGVQEANLLIAETLSDEVLRYLAITQFNDNVTIALVPSGEGMLLDPSTFLSGTGQVLGSPSDGSPSDDSPSDGSPSDGAPSDG